MFIVIFFIQGVFCFSEGSVAFEHVAAIVRQDESVYRLIVLLFEFETDFTGIRLGNNFPFLGGSRIGPYECTVSLKNGVTGDQTYTLIVNTKVVFLDEEKRELDDRIFNARFIKEYFLNIEIRGVHRDSREEKK